MYFERIIDTWKKFCFVIKFFKNSCKSLCPRLMLFQNSRLTATWRQLWNRHSADNHIYWFTAWVAATGIFVLFLRLENKELKLPFGGVAINRPRQISPLWFWAHQLQLRWTETTANGHMTALTVKHSLLEFSSGNKPFQRDWILWVFLSKRKCCKNFLKTTWDECNHREEQWSVLWFSHNPKKKAYPELGFIFGCSQSEVWHSC